jgi:hypothetical protein
MAGYSATPLPKKLGIKNRCRVGLAKAPENFADTLGALPDGVTVTDAARARGPFDVMVCFATTERELAAVFSRLAGKLTEEGGLWVAWPKKSSGVATALDENAVRRAGLATERLVDNKVCAIDQTWSGLRFVVRLSHRA